MRSRNWWRDERGLLLRLAWYRADGPPRRLYRLLAPSAAWGEPRHRPRSVTGEQGGRLHPRIPARGPAVRRQRSALERAEGGMILLALELRARLLANLARGADHVPVVKFFNPLGPRRGPQESRMKTATP